MDFLDNVFSDCPNPNEQKESSPQTPETPSWATTVRKMCHTIQYELSKLRTPDIKNKYAQMDMYIFIGFNCYCHLCAAHRKPELSQSFLDWYEWHGNQNCKMLNKEKKQMFDTRLETYDRIMQSSCKNTDDELLHALANFIAKDINKTPFDSALVIFPIDVIVPIYVQATTLYSSLMKSITAHMQELCTNDNYLPFQY